MAIKPEDATVELPDDADNASPSDETAAENANGDEGDGGEEGTADDEEDEPTDAGKPAGPRIPPPPPRPTILDDVRLFLEELPSKTFVRPREDRDRLITQYVERLTGLKSNEAAVPDHRLDAAENLDAIEDRRMDIVSGFQEVLLAEGVDLWMTNLCEDGGLRPLTDEQVGRVKTKLEQFLDELYTLPPNVCEALLTAIEEDGVRREVERWQGLQDDFQTGARFVVVARETNAKYHNGTLSLDELPAFKEQEHQLHVFRKTVREWLNKTHTISATDTKWEKAWPAMIREVADEYEPMARMLHDFEIQKCFVQHANVRWAWTRLNEEPLKVQEIADQNLIELLEPFGQAVRMMPDADILNPATERAYKRLREAHQQRIAARIAAAQVLMRQGDLEVAPLDPPNPTVRPLRVAPWDAETERPTVRVQTIRPYPSGSDKPKEKTPPKKRSFLPFILIAVFLIATYAIYTVIQGSRRSTDVTEKQVMVQQPPKTEASKPTETETYTIEWETVGVEELPGGKELLRSGYNRCAASGQNNVREIAEPTEITDAQNEDPKERERILNPHLFCDKLKVGKDRCIIDVSSCRGRRVKKLLSQEEREPIDSD